MDWLKIAFLFFYLQSGSLYTDWGWYLSERRLHDLAEGIKQRSNCPSFESIYECLKKKSVEEIFAALPSNPVIDLWHPTPDNDFFPTSVVNESYTLTKRYLLIFRLHIANAYIFDFFAF